MAQDFGILLTVCSFSAATAWGESYALVVEVRVDKSAGGLHKCAAYSLGHERRYSVSYLPSPGKQTTAKAERSRESLEAGRFSKAYSAIISRVPEPAVRIT
jgi:hypothetical protein